MNTDQNLGATPAEVEALVAEFFEQMEPKVKRGRAWTFHRLSAACDTPNAERVQAVLYQMREKPRRSGRGWIALAA